MLAQPHMYCADVRVVSHLYVITSVWIGSRLHSRAMLQTIRGAEPHQTGLHNITIFSLRSHTRSSSLEKQSKRLQVIPR